MKWLDNFKRSIIEQDLDAIINHVGNTPAFVDFTPDEQIELQALLNVATKLIKAEQDNIRQEMNKIQKTKKFLKHEDGNYKFDMSF